MPKKNLMKHQFFRRIFTLEEIPICGRFYFTPSISMLLGMTLPTRPTSFLSTGMVEDGNMGCMLTH